MLHGKKKPQSSLRPEFRHIHAAGWLEGGLTASYEKLIVEAEMLQAFAEYLRPIEVTPETIALEVIAEAGPGGHFFGVVRTMSRFETAFYQPLLSDGQNFEAWHSAGAEDTFTRANRMWKQLLRDYEQLSDYVARRKNGAPAV